MDRAECASEGAVEAVARAPELKPEHVRAVRLGHGANCSSIGSVVDALFTSAVLGRPSSPPSWRR